MLSTAATNGRRPHYAWVVVGVTFLTLLVVAGVRAAPGVLIGLFGAASSAGQLVFLPAMMALTVSNGWRTAIGLTAVLTLVVVLPVLILMRDQPESVGLRALGDDGRTGMAGQTAAERR